jgi:hypothetical protein
MILTPEPHYAHHRPFTTLLLSHVTDASITQAVHYKTGGALWEIAFRCKDVTHRPPTECSYSFPTSSGSEFFVTNVSYRPGYLTSKVPLAQICFIHGVARPVRGNTNTRRNGDDPVAAELEKERAGYLEDKLATFRQEELDEVISSFRRADEDGAARAGVSDFAASGGMDEDNRGIVRRAEKKLATERIASWVESNGLEGVDGAINVKIRKISDDKYLVTGQLVQWVVVGMESRKATKLPRSAD